MTLDLLDLVEYAGSPSEQHWSIDAHLSIDLPVDRFGLDELRASGPCRLPAVGDRFLTCDYGQVRNVSRGAIQIQPTIG
jgi:hypothetical protein